MDLSTHYMGLSLKHPVVASASPLSRDIGGIRQVEDAGASAMVLYSLFEEEISYNDEYIDHYLTHGAESFAEALSYFPKTGRYTEGPEAYIQHVAAAKEAVDIPIIPSINAVALGSWVRYAKQLQEAGADALELNVYFIPTDPYLSAADVEAVYVDIVEAVKETVSIPVAAKIGPYFSSLPHLADRLDRAGASALVLFNRFYQPDFNLEALEVEPDLVLSTPFEMRLPLRWIAILYGHVTCNLAATTAVYTAEDVLKLTMAGADVTMVCSALLKHGLGRIQEIVDGVTAFLEEKEYDSLSQARGSMSMRNCGEPAAFERANYMKTLASYQLDQHFYEQQLTNVLPENR